MIIALSGFMGCGKSTAGRMLAERLPDFDFTDLDDFIEEDAGMSISQIFANGGEKAFRERSVLLVRNEWIIRKL